MKKILFVCGLCAILSLACFGAHANPDSVTTVSINK